MVFTRKILSLFFTQSITDNQKIENVVNSSLNYLINTQVDSLKLKYPDLSGYIDCLITISTQNHNLQKPYSTAIVKSVFIKNSDIENLLFRNEFVNAVKNTGFRFKIPTDKHVKINKLIKF